MPSILGNAVLTLKGEFQTLGESVEVITRPNLDGAALRTVGQRPFPFTMQSIVDVDNAAAAETRAATYQALRGTIGTVVDDHGQSHTNIAVLHCAILRKFPVLTAGGGLSTSMGYMIAARWTFLETNTV